MTTTKIKAGDRVKCIDQGPNAYIVDGNEYTVEEVKGGDMLRVNNGERFTYPASRFELVQATGSIKAGDKVKVVNDDNCSYISNGDVCTVADVDVNGRIKLLNVCAHYYEANRFELATPAPAARKLKLPLAVTRMGGSLVVLTTGAKDGEVTLVYAASGDTSTYTEAEVLSKLDADVWTVNGADEGGGKQAVEDAKAALQAAKDAVTAAEAALATAEATAAQKPYLA